jgi:precorrin-6A synthase
MKKLYIIGIGAGNPEYITVQAIKAMNKVDVFFVMNKGDVKDDLVQLRKEICERYIDPAHPYRIVEIIDPVRDATIVDYTARVEHWHKERVLLYEAAIERELATEECGAFLVWGDPSLYDSTLRIVDQITARANIAFDYEVIPGITSIQALAARHRIPLHGIGESVLITTGRDLSAVSSGSVGNIVVMLDGNCSFANIPPENFDIFWGAYLGMDNEILVSGKLSESIEKIKLVRKEARDRNGWIMDNYLLSKSPRND